MARDDWRERDDGRSERRERPQARDDFGQADYSNDYGYDPRRRVGYRADENATFRGEDYGQADYSTDYGFDPNRGVGYRRFSNEDRDYGRRADSDERREPRYEDDHREGRSLRERASGLFGGRRAAHDDVDDQRSVSERGSHRRRGPSDRVLWAVIVERLEDERRLDLRDVEVVVEGGEVTLNGTVRRKDDKRRIEDIADIDGVRHVQNNLRVREGGRWTFI
jgi:osmotically-inducible protein OsmY